MTRYALVFLSVVGASVPAGRPGGAETAPAPGAEKQARRALKFEHLRIDLTNRRITLDAEVCQAEYALEFLLCRSGTKEYESILRTKAEPSHLHAALLVLGLAAGKPVRWSGQGDLARVLPPQGAELTIHLRWKDKTNKVHQVEAADWLTTGGRGKKRPPKKWVFVGSEVLPDGSYWADMESEGGLVSVANLASAVIDVPFESTQDLNLREFAPNIKVIPKAGTAVEVIIVPLPGAQRAPHARAMLEIDRYGRLRIEGNRIPLEKLTNWAGRFIDRHEKGQVVIRTAGRALAYDIERARDELRIGGVREFDQQILPPSGEILPRTSAQAKQALAQWAYRFVNYKELIREPGAEAEAVLEQIKRDIEDNLGRLTALRGEYAENLRGALAKYKAATQPAKRPQPKE